MSRLLTLAAMAIILTGPAYAVDLGADVNVDTPVVGADVKSRSTVSSHEETTTSPDGSSRVHREEEHRTRVHSSTDADMTVDDEE